MNRLIRDTFYRTSKSFLVRVMFFLMIFLALFLLIFAKVNDVQAHTDEAFIINVLLPVISGCIICNIISSDFTNNTVRNKVIIGHKRSNIYLANMITMSVLILALFLVYEAVFFSVGMIMFDNIHFTSRIAGNILFEIPALIDCAALAVFISMTIKSNTANVVIFMMYYAFLMLAITAYGEELDPSLTQKLKNIADCLPSTEIIFLNEELDIKKPLLKICIYIAETGLFTWGGNRLFKNVDLK